LGPLALQATAARSEDNLDDLKSALKTFAHVTSLNASVPIGSVIRASKPSPFFPQVTWSLSRTHQFATDLPVNSDFSETHVPDQVSATQNVDVAWVIGKWKAGYRYNTSAQDNRQIGREQSDLDNLAHNIGVSVTPKSWLDVGTTFSFEGATNKEVSQENSTRRAGANIDLRPNRNLALASVMSRTWSSSDPRTTVSTNDDVALEVSQNFHLLKATAEHPSGRVFLRYQRQSASQTAFIDTSPPSFMLRHSWVLNSGVSLNAF
jgi:hypothetical protein